MSHALPPSASVANPAGGAKLHTPAAARNVDALTELLREHAPARGSALEIASGTGQHIVAFARALPGLDWQPTDIDATRRASIDAYGAEAGLDNLTEALALDATEPGWGADHAPRDLVLLVNLLHLITMAKVETVIAEAAKALAPGGVLILYGPFMRDGRLTSAGDLRFDADLRAADPGIGYKDTLDIARLLSDAALSPIDTREMPANNLAFIARKPVP